MKENSSVRFCSLWSHSVFFFFFTNLLSFTWVLFETWAQTLSHTPNTQANDKEQNRTNERTYKRTNRTTERLEPVYMCVPYAIR